MKAIFYAAPFAGKLVHEHPEKLKAFIAGLKPTIRQKITIEKYIQKRSSQQRKYYFGVVVKLIADHCGMTPQEAHEALKWMFLQERGEYMPTVRSTAKLTTKEFMDYIEQCVIWAAEFLQIVVPDPNFPDEF